MIVYEATKEIFINDVINNQIAGRIEQLYRLRVGQNVNPREKEAWKNSMMYMNNVLNDVSIPNNSGIAIEFKIPYTSKRIDFIITGRDKQGRNIAIIVELKQWTEAEIVEGQDGIVRTFTGGAMREVAHPSYQAWSYAAYIEDFNENVQRDNVKLLPCAYLHNYENVEPKTILSDKYKDYIEKAPVFISGDALKLREFIKKYVTEGDNKETLYLIENGKIKPSKSLQDCIAGMVKQNKEFILLDNQKVVYETAMEMAKKSNEDGKKRCLIVKGGPGTGKTVLAINLLSDLTNKPYEMVCHYVTKNAAPRAVFKAKLKGTEKISKIDNMFKGSGIYTEAKKDDVGVILADEAHRLNAKSGMFKNQGENQIKEIINAAKFSVFFIDETQRIDIYDIGSVAEIEKYLDEFGIVGEERKILELESQFRCNGSDGYLAWLDDVLEIRQTANNDGFDIDYDIQIMDNPNDVKDKIFELNKINNKARLLAGYCWNWIKEGKNDTKVHDIVIPKYNFEMSWNLGSSSTWAIDPESVNEVGCIHTSQGLEFDYAGVIIGKDLRYENGKIITDFTERASTDNSLKGIKKMYKENPEKALKLADEIIKNTYRTLMTRGQKGCYIYCEDKPLAEYLKSRINRCNGITYPIDNEEDKYTMMVAEEGEEYKYE